MFIIFHPLLFFSFLWPIMTKRKNVAQILIDTLVNAGVKRCYGIVGDTLNLVTDAIANSTIEWVHVRHEEVGAFAAGADAFITGTLTACAGSCGPGSLHFINGIYEAHRNGASVIFIASQLPTSNLGTAFPQEVNLVELYRNCSVFCQQIDNANNATRVFSEAVQTAINKRGVAVVVLPSDILKSDIDNAIPQTIWHPQPILKPNYDEMQQLVTLINTGKKIGIYAGVGCRYAHDELIQLARILKAPIAYTARVKDAIEYENPYHVGMNGIFGTKAGVGMIQECDTLLLLGCGFAWSEFYPNKAMIIQIDLDATQLGLRHPIGLGLVGDIKATLQALLPLLTERYDLEFLNHYTQMFQKETEKLDRKAIAESGKSIHPQYLVELIDEYATENALFTADTGTAMVWACRHIHTNGKRRLLCSLKHASMANAMPQAIGLQKAYPERQVIALCGDGGLTMLLGDLFTIIQEKLPIKIFVVNNGSLNFVELEQKQAGMLNRYTNLQNGDFAMMAQSIGFFARNVDTVGELEDEVKHCLNHDGAALLNVYTNPNELIIPPTTSVEDVKNFTLYGIKAILGGRSKEVIKMIKDNL